MALILPLAMATSAVYVSVAVTTEPFLMIVSKPIESSVTQRRALARNAKKEFYATLPHFTCSR